MTFSVLYGTVRHNKKGNIMKVNRKDIEKYKTTREFVDYVLSFYGKGCIYDFGVKKNDVVTATVIYLNKVLADKTETYTWGDGDSLDRERVRDILLDQMGYEWKETAKLRLDLTK